MRNIIARAIIFLSFCAAFPSVQGQTIIEHNLPPGWMFKSFDVSRSNLKALSLLPDVPEEVLLTGYFPKRVQVFNQTNELISDLTLEDGFSFAKFTRNDRIIICAGDESGCYRMKVLEPSGKERCTIQAEGRWPITAPAGRDIALVPGPENVGPISIIDEDTGREKARLDPPPNNGSRFKVAAFLPLGEDGQYIQGIGATLFLKSYLHIGEIYWQIQDIGGNIRGGMYLNDEYIAVSFGTKDFSDHKIMAGVAVVECKTGAILFKKEGFQINGIKDAWFSRLNVMSVFLDNGSLYFYGNPDDVFCFPMQPGGRRGRNERTFRNDRLSPDQAEEIRVGGRVIKPEVQAGKYVIKNFGDVVRIEKSRYINVR